MTMGILLIIFLVLLVNILWYFTKQTLKENGYQTNWFWNHFKDIPNIFGLAIGTQDKGLKTKYFTMGISLVTGIVIFIFLAFNLVPSIDDNNCSFQREFDYKEWNGVVAQKYLDKPNHMYETLEVHSNSKALKIQDFVTDFNSSYDAINVGDSLSKKRGNNYVTVYRKGIEKKLIVDCGCKE